VSFSESRKRSIEGKNKGNMKLKEVILLLKAEEDKTKKQQIIKTRLLCHAKYKVEWKTKIIIRLTLK